ncbi:MAG TPA: acylneuraminate cytidylyltransferase family protein [Helicobacteraceae bacterium]|nr:acylneuraminate cytidylyltransferase family protein [Helicobacteraceae bacterium]
MHKPSVIAIIPARGGSKGLPGKNIYPLANKPLIAWSIEAALNSTYIDDVVVTSESNEILKVADDFGAKTLKRPEELAQDTTLTEPVITHLLESIETTYEYLILLQPTSPLRDSKDINNAFSLLYSHHEADGLISVYEPTHHPLKSFTNTSEGYLKGLYNNQAPFMRRQDLPIAYYPNGAIYITKTTQFLETHKLYSEKTLPFVMSEARSLDIDTLEDIQKTERYLQKESNARD